MRKTLGFTLALTLALSLSAAAAEMKSIGTVKAVDPAGHSFVLEDGTRYVVSDSHLTDLKPGDKVEAVYEMQGDKKIVTDLNRRTIGADGQATTNFGSRTGSRLDSIESSD
jgi:Cu/Ag efflux protein CusF